MPSFFRSNKSHFEGSSREGSPIHPEVPTNTYPSPPQRYPIRQSQYDGTNDPAEQERHYQPDQARTHPAHQVTRSQSHRISAGSDAAYQSPERPSVHIVEASSPNTGPSIYEQQSYSPQSADQLQPPAHERERRRSKRSIFGIHSSSKAPKENTSPISGRAPARTGSLLRKAQPDQPGLQAVPISGPYPQAKAGNPAYQERDLEGSYESQDSLTDSEDRTPIAGQLQQDHRQLGQPRLQQGVQSENQVRGEIRYYQQAQQQYQSDQERRSEESPETPLQYQQHHYQQRAQEEENPPAFDPRQVRSPSQLSVLGPPSPGTLSVDSRPSSATNVSNQSRLSTQSKAAIGPVSQQQQQQQHLAMPRGEPPPNGLRDQMSHQRDLRLQDPAHGPYASQQDPRSRVSQHAEQGRATPPPRSREDIGSMDFQTLLQRHEELQSKYSKVKRYYFEKDTQVTQLQNLIANQRLSMSKTMFDDHQYVSRFERLNGAIRDLAFSIRKDWKGIPSWLTHVVNQNAHTIGRQEMTAVGRACIACWLMDEIFNRYFHPDLEQSLSIQLKLIERTLRRSGNATQIVSDEQREDLTTKLISWRLATVEGLSDHLASSKAVEFRTQLVHTLSERLTTALKVNLQETTPPGLDTGVGMIIELAVSIAQCLPMESRDVCIEYFMPGTPLNDTCMRIEASPAPLNNPGAMSMPPDDSDDNAEGNPEDNPSKLENDIREASGKAIVSGSGGRTDSLSTASSKDSKAQKKGSIFGSLVTKLQQPDTTSAGSGIGGGKDAAERGAESNEGLVRMAVFFAVEVRGKAGTGKEGGGSSGGERPVVLIRAPVFGYT